MSAPLPAARSNCPVARSLDLLGDRWTLVLLRDMLVGDATRFGEFAVDEGIATNVLSDRLERLQAAGLVDRRRDPDDGRRWLYLPTESALGLVGVIVDLMVWGSTHTSGEAPSWLIEAAAADRDVLVRQLQQSARARSTAHGDA